MDPLPHDSGHAEIRSTESKNLKRHPDRKTLCAKFEWYKTATSITEVTETAEHDRLNWLKGDELLQE